MLKRKKFCKIIIIFFCFVSTKISAANVPEARDGFIDLSKWDLSNDGVVSLKGEWDFFPGELISPQAFPNSPSNSIQRIILPGIWGSPLDFLSSSTWRGYFTFHLRVKVKAAGNLLVLRINQFALAYRVWINDQLMVTNGKVGKSKADSQLSVKPVKFSFTPPVEIFHITIQYANYWDRFGSRSRDLILGLENDIERRVFLARRLGLANSAILIFSIMGFLSLYFITKNRNTLYLIIFCVAIIIRIIMALVYPK